MNRNTFSQTRVSRLILALIVVIALFLANGQLLLAQAAPQAGQVKQFDLKQPGTQVVNLARIPWDSQKAGRIVGDLACEKGELSGTLVLRMLSRDGEDLAPQAKQMGFNDPTREFPVTNLKGGTAFKIDENFVSGSGAAWVGVELIANVKTAPCIFSVASLTIKDRADAVRSDQNHADGTLITSPLAGFNYSRNLLPPPDAMSGDFAWKATGEAATRGKGMAGQTTLLLSERGAGKWESPIVPLSGDSRQLCLQTFARFDAMATPREHPFEIIFRDAEGKILTPAMPRNWRWATRGHMYGTWIPLSMQFTAPEKAVSIQVVLGMRELATPPWQTGAAKLRNNFGTFEASGLALWTTSAPPLSDRFRKTAFAGNAASSGPFTPCAATQQNSVVLTTHLTSTGNFSFGPREQWTAPKIWVENYLPVRRSIIVTGDVFNWTGKKIETLSLPVELEPYQNKDVELPVARPEKAGVYSANLDAHQDGVLVGQDVARWGYFFQASDRADRHDEQYPFFFHPKFMADDNGTKDPSELKREVQTLRAMGVRGVRLQFRLWSFDATKPERGIEGLHKFGDNYRAQIEPFIQQGDLEAYISFFPKPRSSIPATDEELSVWREYVAAAVREFPKIKVFIFGNEEIGSRNVNLEVKPLVWGYSGSLREYIVQFLEARKAAMQARPDILFLIGHATDPQAHIARLFFEAGGTVKDLQGWATNSYNTPGPIWAKVSETLQKNGVDVSSMTGILPEIGYNYPPRGPNRLSGERFHAVAVLRTHLDILAAAPWVKYITFFATIHAGVENHGVFDADGSPKPAAGAYLCMTQTLGAGRPIRVTELPGATAYLWKRSDGSKIGILWTSGRQQARVRVGETDGPVIVRDFMGNDVSVQPRSGVIDVEISESPIYLLNVKTMEDGSDVAVDWTLERDSDGARRVKTVIRNQTAKTLEIDGHFNDSPGIAWTDPTVPAMRLSPGEAKSITRGFSLAGEGFTEWTPLSVTLRADGNANVSGFSSSLLTARKTATSPLDYPAGDAWKNSDFAVMKHLRQETHQQGPIRWAGPDDLSARCAVQWDEKNLYFFAQVTDDVHVQATDAERMWSNDSIQIGIRPASSSIGTELTLGTAEEKPVAFKLESKERRPLEQEEAQMKVTRDEASHITTYQAAIAWSAVNIPKPSTGDRLRFGIVVNDCDHPEVIGEDRQGIQWFSGIFQKDATKWGDLTLCD